MSTSNDEINGGAGVDPVSPSASQPGLNPGNELSTANADAGEIALLKEDMASVRHMLSILSSGLQNQASSRVPPPATSGLSVGPPPARGSEYRGYGSEMEKIPSPQVTIAWEQEYTRAAAFEKIMQRAGFVDEHVHTPRCHEMVLQAREAAQRLAACRLTQRPGEEDDHDDLDEDSGVGAIAELPPEVPAWSPKPLLARRKFFTKAGTSGC
jgi:hypothetical protein